MRYISLIIGKIIFFVLRLLGKNGGSLPGKVAIKYCPDILKYFKYPSKTILVTGTNGKTSTANLIYQSFAKDGYNTISNSRGDNIINGITSLLIKNASFNFDIRADVLVLEVDESTLAKNVKNIKASDIVITNFFRDQLDRVGEMETLILKIQNALSDYKANLYINEDDPNVKRFAKFTKANVITYGLDKIDSAYTKNIEAKEGKFCPICSSELDYEYYHYSHIGKYRCTNCTFASGIAYYLASDIKNGTFVITNKEQKQTIHYSISATYHIYNLTGAFAVLYANGVNVRAIDDVFEHFNLGIGRMETIDIKGKKVLLNLVKNPTGCNEIIKYIESDESKKSLIFLLNDNHADGTDTSWIWDVNFEQINNLKTVIITGKRAYEGATRFKLARICENIIVEKDVSKAIDILLEQNTKYYVISTYTGLFDIRSKLLGK